MLGRSGSRRYPTSRGIGPGSSLLLDPGYPVNDEGRSDSRPGNPPKRLASLILTASVAVLVLWAAWGLWRPSGMVVGLWSLLAPLTGAPRARGMADIAASSPYRN